jgi:hypothetical protein
LGHGVKVRHTLVQCLIKFNVFFWVGFSTQWISLVLIKKSDFEFYTTIITLPISILLLVEGYLATRHENRWMMYGFMGGCVAGCGYFAYKVRDFFWRVHNPIAYNSRYAGVQNFTVETFG